MGHLNNVFSLYYQLYFLYYVFIYYHTYVGLLFNYLTF